jgi:hypothetical protein
MSEIHEFPKESCRVRVSSSIFRFKFLTEPLHVLIKIQRYIVPINERFIDITSQTRFTCIKVQLQAQASLIRPCFCASMTALAYILTFQAPHRSIIFIHQFDVFLSSSNLSFHSFLESIVLLYMSFWSRHGHWHHFEQLCSLYRPALQIGNFVGVSIPICEIPNFR